jgi:uncharacterized membrane protein YoaK (UPF0700 family)
VSAKQVPRVGEKAWLALVLALTAGCVDAVGYLVLWQVFTAHMSGNSVSAVVHAGEDKQAAAFHRAFPIPFFVLGVALGAAMSETLARSAWRRIFAVAAGVEATVSLVFMLGGGAILQNGRIAEEPAWRFYLLVALPALAMGVQNASLRRVGNLTVRTTYISGMLTNFAEQSVQYLFWLRDHAAEHRGQLRTLLRRSTEQPSFLHMCLQAGIWFLFVAGALFGVWATLRWGLRSLLGPIGCLSIIALCDFIDPICPQNARSHKPEWT